MRPKMKPTPVVWFCDQAYGNNKIGNTVKKLCDKVGIDGKYTNHSLRATSASRMYQADVPEQMIKEVTGHKSDCVRIYKRTSDDIRKVASNTIAGSSGVESEVNDTEGIVKDVQSVVKQEVCSDKMLKFKKRDSESLSVLQMIKNVIKTRLELRRKKNQKVNKIVSKIVKRPVHKSVTKKNKGRNIVVDVNFNVKFTK